MYFYWFHTFASYWVTVSYLSRGFISMIAVWRSSSKLKFSLSFDSLRLRLLLLLLNCRKFIYKTKKQNNNEKNRKRVLIDRYFFRLFVQFVRQCFSHTDPNLCWFSCIFLNQQRGCSGSPSCPGCGTRHRELTLRPTLQSLIASLGTPSAQNGVKTLVFGQDN